MMTARFVYRNHREEIAEREVIVHELAWKDDDAIREYGYEPGLFLSGIDLPRNVYRSFSLKRIIPQEGNPVLINFRNLYDQEAIDMLIRHSKALVDSVLKDEHGTAIGRFQDGNGGLVSKETHQAADELRRLMDFYK